MKIKKNDNILNLINWRQYIKKGKSSASENQMQTRNPLSTILQWSYFIR